MTEIDMDAYNSSEDKIKPGQHEEFNIHPTVHSFQEFTAQPDVEDVGTGKKAEGMTNETGWMMNPTFEERFSGAQPMPEYPEIDPNALEGNWIPHGRATPPGWSANRVPQYSPRMDFTPQSDIEWDRQKSRQYTDPNHYPSLLWQQKPNVFPNASGPMHMPFDPNTPEVYNFPISMKDEPPKMFPDAIPMVKDLKAQHQESIGGYAQQGMSIRQIAKEMDLHPSKVQRILKTLGIQTTGKSDTRFGAENANPGGPGGSKPGEQRGAAKPGVNKGNQNARKGPDWFKEEMNDPEDKAIREWMKNQFEGAPIEPELINSMQKYLTDTKTAQMRNPANTNTELHPSQGKDPYRMIEDHEGLEVSWDQFRRIHELRSWLTDVFNKPNEEFLLNQRLRQTKADNKSSGTNSKMEIDSINARLDQMKRMKKMKWTDLPTDEK